MLAMYPQWPLVAGSRSIQKHYRSFWTVPNGLAPQFKVGSPRSCEDCNRICCSGLQTALSNEEV